MFVPLHDQNPLNHVRFQYVTIALIISNCAIYIMTILTLPSVAANEMAFSYGVIPAVLFDLRDLPTQLAILPDELTLVSYMFLHGSWMHLIGNMMFLWVFGDNVEDAMGHMRFLIFYLSCGVFAGFLHSVMLQNSELPLIGASGAVAGVIAAYLMLHPRVKVWVLLLWRIPFRIPALWALGFWVILQVLSLLTADEGENTAWWAHIGGIFAGAILVMVMRRRDVPLFDQGLVDNVTDDHAV